MNTALQTIQNIPGKGLVQDLSVFINTFKGQLLDSLGQSNPPVYTPEKANPIRQAIMDNLSRQPFPAQAEIVQAVCALLIERNEPAAIINAEMGSGKSMMAITIAAVLFAEGYKRSLIISPPHLVYKWRREILETVPHAKVWVMNGPDTLAKLLQAREALKVKSEDVPEFYILGRVRMRMGYHWQPVCRKGRFVERYLDEASQKTFTKIRPAACCPDCFSHIINPKTEQPYTPEEFYDIKNQQQCESCGSKLWTLMNGKKVEVKQKGSKAEEIEQHDFRKQLVKEMCKIPTIGSATANKLINTFGTEFIAEMLVDNVHNFINLMDEQGDLVFNDSQAVRMERALGKIEFSFGQGGYQASEFIKRYLPQGYFDLMIVDEGHEYKNEGSAQGQAMGVLASKVRKIVLLTGTLMGGYAADLFYLLFRVITSRMIEDGYKPNERGSLATASTAFQRDHGVLKDIFTEKQGESHKTAKGNKMVHRTSKAPGFGPKGILRYVLPFTVFLKLKEIGGDILPDYTEEFVEVDMTDDQQEAYNYLVGTLTTLLKKALARGDTSLLGVVLNTLLAWPDCCFREEEVTHPRDTNDDGTHKVLATVESLFTSVDIMPKEAELIRICREEKANNRRVLVYTTYTQTRDTTHRLKTILEREGFKVGVLKCKPEEREDWILARVDEGIDILICNPEQVKTGLDLLDFPTIVFMQTGWSVYTMMQASRRSWRIGQTLAVRVLFLGYRDTTQINCLELMAKKIAVTQSTSGDIPDSGLDCLNPDSESVEMALAKQLLAKAA
ncbi:DEAD/DEAH box helicase [Entomomonas sp. E2T0]|uniref:DEAD/DEAH box helicase family protein n=1 Tax=Entomomonas sp. E2T0 TaxID=2930213 RepID=UPI002228287E|nr:DEAD/DEAH box helicase family protein [Entomomonas sp. E2T0]UYZ83062.1 DEAD/DEAH box helicase [Entomomonas sp. E2T0]